MDTSAFELRSRAAELVQTSEEVALGSPSVVRRLRAHNTFCDLLRLPSDSFFRTSRASTIVDEGLSENLRSCDISDRILACSEVPEPTIIELDETPEDIQDISYPKDNGGSDDGGTSAPLRSEAASTPEAEQ